MVDEPRGDARPNDSGPAAQPASQFEAEWRDGLSRVMSALEAELGRAVDVARRQANDTVSGIERQGFELLTSFDQQRRAVEAECAAAEERLAETRASIEAAQEEARQVRERAEHEAEQTVVSGRQRADAMIAEAEERQKAAEAEWAAVQDQVAQTQADIAAVEEELRQSREDADREAQETIAAARRRAETIVARAEARADVIIAEAQAEAASRRSASAGRAGAATDARPALLRFREMSERVGSLGSRFAPAGAAGAAAADAEAPGSAVAPPIESTVRPAEIEDEPDEPPAAEAEQVAEDDEPEEVAPTVEVRATPASRGPATPPDLMRSWSRASEADDAADAPTISAPAAASSAQDEDAQVFVRRSPQPEPVSANDHVDESEPEPEPAAPAAPATPPIPEPVAGPAGAVTQTLIFQSVPNFQAALALERSLKAMTEVREVQVADFDERQLTFRVTHELGSRLPGVLLTQRAGELEFVEARPERVEFVFRT